MAEGLFSLCLVTDRTRTGGRPLLSVVESALRGGVDALQLREKDLPAGVLLALARSLRALCDAHGARLLINDRVDVALACAADGVHLPVDACTPADARRLLGAGKLIGASVHSKAEAERALAGGVDYLICGPIFDTPSKRPFGPPIGPAMLSDVARATTVPVIAIGGITAARVEAVRRCGARGVAVVGAILEADDPQSAAAALRARV